MNLSISPSKFTTLIFHRLGVSFILTQRGTVSDSNGPCSDRIINLTQINRSSDQSSINAGTVSNNVGAFIFENIPNGEYAITSGDARVKVNVSNSNVLCDLDLDY